MLKHTVEILIMIRRSDEIRIKHVMVEYVSSMQKLRVQGIVMEPSSGDNKRGGRN